MTRLLSFASLLFFLLTAPRPALSQRVAGGASVTGIVLSEGHNQRLSGVVVRLCDSGGNLIEQTTTPDSGEFAFRGLQRSAYILSLAANGFQPIEMQLDLNFASDRGISIYLKPLANDSAPSGTGPTISAHELSMPQGARDLVVSGKKKLYVEKKASMALKDFQQAVENAPDYYEAYCEIAMAYLSMSKSEEAIKSFRKSIEVSKDTYGDAEVGLGTLLIEKGSLDSGEVAIKRGIALNPNSWTGFYELSKLDLNRNRLDAALVSAERARSLAPNAPIIYRLLTIIHLREQNYQAALADIDSYLALDPSSEAGVRAAQMRKQIAEKAAMQAKGIPAEH